LIAESLRADEGIDVSPEAIVVTVGAQEAMLLVLRALFASPDDVLLVSSPCYVGITGAARLLDIPVAPVPEGIAGLARGGLDSAVRAARSRGVRPRAVYVTPDHSNPSGSTIPEPDRHELVKLAGRLGVLIIEDSPYRLVSPGERLPTLKRLDRRGAVIHLGSFAKSMFPGARMGFVVADQEVTSSDGQTALLADELAKIKSMVTVNTSPLSQAVIAGMLIEAGGGAAARNKETSEYYGAAMTATLRELDLIFPAHRRARLRLRWSQPSGGFFIAMSVPFRADNAALGRSAQHHGVIWTPMSYFHPDGGGAFQLRLSISYLTEAEITEGVTRLAAFIEDEAHRQEVSDQETRNHEEGQR
jgi:(S)-3,5-dihydroxyphenylglycine transaminase